jgi:hypothetical protein
MRNALILALALFASPLAAQTVTNGSFENYPGPAIGAPPQNWNTAAATGWTCPNVGGGHGLQVPTAAQVASGIDGKTAMWLNTGSNCFQDVGPTVAQTNYSLMVSVGSQVGFSGAYTVSYAGCSTSGTTQQGSLSPVTLPCPTPTGELVITLASTSGQVIFDNVILTSTPVTPPTFDTLTFGVALVNCTKCDATDNVPLASASIYQGASFSLTQDGQNVCSATFNASAQATCTGPVNVTPSFVNLTPIVTDPSGKQLNSGQTTSFPSLLASGAVTGNVKLILGFDAATMLPRSVQVYTQ